MKQILKFYNQYKGTEDVQGTRDEFQNEIVAGAIQKGISYEQYLKEYSEVVDVPFLIKKKMCSS